MKDTKTVVDAEYNAEMHSKIRWRNTLRLLPDFDFNSCFTHCDSCQGRGCYQDMSILEIGDRSGMTDLLVDKWKTPIASTGSQHDFDIDGRLSDFFPKDIILSCEILEHLMNPLYHLIEVKKILKPNGTLYLTTPKKKFEFLWTRWHWHEMSLERLTFLFDKAGFKIVKRRKALTRSWWFYLTGFRPFLRLFVDWMYYFELKHKD